MSDELWGADISTLAGKNADLKFEAFPLNDLLSPQAFLRIDNIAFSTVPISIVPEPCPLVLLGIGVIGLGWMVRPGSGAMSLGSKK